MNPYKKRLRAMILLKLNVPMLMVPFSCCLVWNTTLYKNTDPKNGILKLAELLECHRLVVSSVYEMDDEYMVLSCSRLIRSTRDS